MKHSIEFVGVHFPVKLSGRKPDSQSREPWFESPLLPFQKLGIFVLSTTPPVSSPMDWIHAYLYLFYFKC